MDVLELQTHTGAHPAIHMYIYPFVDRQTERERERSGGREIGTFLISHDEPSLLRIEREAHGHLYTSLVQSIETGVQIFTWNPHECISLYIYMPTYLQRYRIHTIQRETRPPFVNCLGGGVYTPPHVRAMGRADIQLFFFSSFVPHLAVWIFKQSILGLTIFAAS